MDSIKIKEGALIINKPKGYTSHDIVNILRKKLNTRKIGHTGTLDPNATGVLPILIEGATKASKYLIEHKKTYIATIELGKQTDTGDSEGKIIKIDTEIKDIENKDIEKTLNKFLGKQKQKPPLYSAIKINGKKMYEYARLGQEVDVKEREIEIYSIYLKERKNNEIIFETECSKGTYIRTLCEDIAKELGTLGYMKELQRIKVNEFTIEEAICLEEIDKINLSEKIIPLEKIFQKNEKITLDDKRLKLFLNGVQISIKLENGLYKIYNKNKFIGLGIIKDKLLKRDIVIQNIL